MKISNGQVTYEEEATKFYPEGCPEGNNSGGDCPWCQIYYGWACPRCASTEIIPEDEGKWPYCEDCGFVLYDAETLQLQAEVKREQDVCKQALGYVPSYQEAREKGFAK